jgi:HEAT repeat protein
MPIDLQHLLESLSDPVLPVSDDALEAISDLDTPRLQTFQTAWETWSPGRKGEVLGRLGHLADENIELNFDRINTLALADADAGVRRQAIQNLWECEDPGLGQRLAGLLAADTSAEVRATAAAALGRFVYLGEVEEIDEQLLLQVEDRLLGAHRSDPDETVRLRCLESLGYAARPEVSPLIEAAYSSPDERQIQAALKAMARSASPVWDADILENLHHAAPGIRAEATRAAGELELRSSADDLIELTEDAIDEVRQAAIWSLAQIGGEAATQALARLLELSSNEDETALLEDALDYIAFVDGTRDIPLLDLDAEDPSR